MKSPNVQYIHLSNIPHTRLIENGSTGYWPIPPMRESAENPNVRFVNVSPITT